MGCNVEPHMEYLPRRWLSLPLLLADVHWYPAGGGGGGIVYLS